MKLGVMPGDMIPEPQLQEEGFAAMQLFWGMGANAADQDPTPAQVTDTLAAGDLALAAMTLHIGLVGPGGALDGEVARGVGRVKATAGLGAPLGDNPRPILVWHPSGYPEAEGDDVDDEALFEGLCQALATVCAAAETHGVDVAVEITRAGTVGSAETFLHLADRVGSPALKVCLDAANFVPDRTPLVRAVRRLASYIAIAHGKDSRFRDDGTVAAYGSVGSGRLDYRAYMQALLEFVPDLPYFVLEYYRSREDLLVARDIVRSAME